MVSSNPTNYGIASQDMPLLKEYDSLRGLLLGLPEVRLGRRFGEEAFFVKKRFFCHFHRGGTLLLETFVWDRVNEVIHAIPGVIPHPQYGAYGWVRLRIPSQTDVDKARKLIEMSYRCVVSTKRISIPKTGLARKAVQEAVKRFPNVRFRMKLSSKRIQVIMQVYRFKNSHEAGEILGNAADYLRNH